jgi:YgiT-type zinc finger domain-containing protein
MICLICRKAEIVESLATVEFKRDEFKLVVKEVPARVCPSCSEAFVDENVAAQLLLRDRSLRRECWMLNANMALSKFDTIASETVRLPVDPCRFAACFACFYCFCGCQPESPACPVPSAPTQAVIETITPSPIPTITLTASATPTVEELIYPFTIDGLREHDFQSGKINIRSTLSKNDKFTTYLIDYPSEELTITGVMQIPEGDGPFPVILLNHGFFSRSVYNSGDGTDRASAFLAEHGYITLSSDYRSWGGSEVGTSFFYSGLAMDVIN